LRLRAPQAEGRQDEEIDALDARRFWRFLERTRRAPSLAKLSYMLLKAPLGWLLSLDGEGANIEKLN